MHFSFSFAFSFAVSDLCNYCVTTVSAAVSLCLDCVSARFGAADVADVESPVLRGARGGEKSPMERPRMERTRVGRTRDAVRVRHSVR